MGEKREMVYWHFFKPITIVLSSVQRQNSLRKELVLVERVRSKVALVVQEKTQIEQTVYLAVWIYPVEI